MAYDQISPIGPERNDCNAALISMTIAEINRDQKKRTKPFKLVDFLLFARKEKRVRQATGPMTEKEMTDEFLKYKSMLKGVMGGK